LEKKIYAQNCVTNRSLQNKSALKFRFNINNLKNSFIPFLAVDLSPDFFKLCLPHGAPQLFVTLQTVNTKNNVYVISSRSTGWMRAVVPNSTVLWVVYFHTVENFAFCTLEFAFVALCDVHTRTHAIALIYRCKQFFYSITKFSNGLKINWCTG